MNKIVIIAIALSIYFIFTISCNASPPQWFNSGIKVEGSIATIPCEGTGPDLSTARAVSMSTCQTTALAYVPGYNIESRTLVVEDNQAVQLHAETSSKTQVAGLKCQPIQETSEEIKESGSYRDYMLCRFDLAKTKVVSLHDKVAPSVGGDDDKGAASTSHGLVQNADSLGSLQSSDAPLSRGKTIQSENRQLAIVSIPPCDLLIIRGSRARSIKCDESPKTVLTYPQDTEIIVKKGGGYQPKHIFLNHERKPASDSGLESVTVLLEKM